MTRTLREHIRHLAAHEASNSRLLREYVTATLTTEGGLSPAEMRKVFGDPKRLEALTNQLRAGTPFELTSGKVVKFDDQGVIEALAAAVAARDEASYKSIMASGLSAHEVDETGQVIPGSPVIVVKSMSDVLKTKAFGSSALSPRERAERLAKGEKVKPTGVENESEFVSQIKRQIELNDDKPITIKLGSMTFPGVTGAAWKGGEKTPDGETSKADVVLYAGNKKYNLSLKLPTAEYYLSGDYLLGDIAGEILKVLMNPAARAKLGLDVDITVNRTGVTQPNRTGGVSKFDNALVDSKGKLVNVKFPLSRKVREEAVFGRGDNKIDYIVKGDLSGDPTRLKDGTLSWNVSLSPPDLSQIPAEDQPVGLLRHATGRGLEGFKGIRPVVGYASRAKNAIDVSKIFGVADAVIPPDADDDEPDSLSNQALRPPKRKVIDNAPVEVEKGRKKKKR